MEKTPSPVSGLPALSAAMLTYHDLKTSPSCIRGKAEKEDAPLPVTSSMSSLGGCSDPGFLGSQTHPVLSRGSGIRNQNLRLPKQRLIPGKRYQCSSDGCRLAFRSMKELLDHMRVHYRPTQSLEGKTFRCSALDCVESFPNMQDLMDHMKVHYKLNRYFKCENCTSRFRTYRSLFKHLHVCSDSTSPSPSLMAEKPVLPPTSGPEKEPPGKLLEELPQLQSVIQHIKKEALLPPGMTEAASALATGSLPATSLEAMPLPTPAAHPYPLLESSLFGPPTSLARFSGPPHPSVPGPYLPYMHPSTYALPQASVQSRLRPYLPGQGLPVSNAVWKKSQGHSSNSRIVWQHTRGRYNCLQCPYSTPSREEMTQHIEDHRKNPSPPGRLDGEMDFGVGLPSFHPKLTPDMESSLFTPL
ncbi:zinc finger protein 414-like [Tiliqua scincoides]|uniref:zinc finger protein 414-like n=1 Tax=Tiliqua scincoides TaxID=71010 RepID=UPI0034623082